jgi:hypothetical protein
MAWIVGPARTGAEEAMDAAIIEEYAQKLRAAGAGATLVLFTRGGHEHPAHDIRTARDLVYLTHDAGETVILRSEIVAIRFRDAKAGASRVGF